MKKIFYGVVLSAFLASCDKPVETPTNTNQPASEHYELGNPSNATTEVTKTDNFLLVKKQMVICYNNTLGRANWVSWRIAPEWLGSTPRQDDFRPDDKLPSTYYKASSGTYTGSGFDRGHICPSGDRTASTSDNSSTFTMTNMLPQAPNVNQGNWADLENYCRKLVDAGNELYVISGGRGEGGSGSNGGTTKRLDNGKLIVPSHCWKVVVILPKQTGTDIDRIDEKTRVIAIEIPNKQSAGAASWGDYRLSVDDLEKNISIDSPGFDLLNKVPKAIQDKIEAIKDTGKTQ